MERVGAEIYVSGLVQGVFYRAFAESTGDDLGLAGYCQNLKDGRVLVKAEGDRALIEELIKLLWVGPPAAHVRDVKVTWEPWEGNYRGFTIRR